MNLFFKSPKDSETGKRFTEICKRGDVCLEVLKAFLDKHGFQQYRPSRISHTGGVSSCIKPINPVDKKAWKLLDYGFDEWMPRLNCKAGKAIMEEIKASPIVDIDELNAIVGYKGNGLKSSHIGFSGKNDCKTDYGFVLVDKWNVTPPADCVEITASEYKKLFGSENDD